MLDVHGDFDLFFGGAQGIPRDPRRALTGGADQRRDGAVIVY